MPSGERDTPNTKKNIRKTKCGEKVAKLESLVLYVKGIDYLRWLSMSIKKSMKEKKKVKQNKVSLLHPTRWYRIMECEYKAWRTNKHTNMPKIKAKIRNNDKHWMRHTIKPFSHTSIDTVFRARERERKRDSALRCVMDAIITYWLLVFQTITFTAHFLFIMLPIEKNQCKYLLYALFRAAYLCQQFSWGIFLSPVVYAAMADVTPKYNA